MDEITPCFPDYDDATTAAFGRYAASPSASLDSSNQSHNCPCCSRENSLIGIILPDQPVGFLDHDPDHFRAPIEPITLREGLWRHSGWRHQRIQVWQALKRARLNDTRLERFANCGSGMSLEYTDPEKLAKPSDFDVRIAANTCHDRFCVPCGAARAFAIYTGLQARMEGKAIKFITLTLRCNGKSLKDRLDRLYTCFSQLRRRKLWTNAVQGGAAFCECKLGKSADNWHVHLHLLCECDFIAQKDLSSEWHAVTGDSFIVDIRQPDQTHGVARYVTKYVTKPASKEVYDSPAALDEMISALKGRRLCLTFGTWRGTPLKPHRPSSEGWKSLCRMDHLLANSTPNSPLIAMCLNVLAHRYPDRFSLTAEFDSARIDTC